MRLSTIAFSLGLLLQPMLGTAGVSEVPCDRPYVFSGAEVNVVVLPFNLPPDLKAHSEAGDRLSLLIQREALLSIAKFGSVGSVQLRETPRKPCRIEIVRAQLLGEIQGAQSVVQPGRGLLLVWGRIFESGNRLFVQSYVQFLRKGLTERIEVRLGDQRLVGELSGQGFAGLQRLMSIDDLRAIEDASVRAMTLHEKPDENSRKTEIPPDVPFYYYVTEIQGDWMRVATFVPGDLPPQDQVAIGKGVFPGQWIKAKAAQREWSLSRFLPEMAFIEAVSGYLGLRVALDQRGPSVLKDDRRSWALRHVDQRLSEYLETISRNQVLAEGRDPIGGHALAVAVPLQVQGIIRLLDPNPDTKSIREARARFADAARLLPASADARNLEVMTRLLLAYRGADDALTGQAAASVLLDAVGLEPGNSTVLRNLASAYELLLLPSDRQPKSWTPLDAEQRSKTAAQLKAVRAIASLN